MFDFLRRTQLQREGLCCRTRRKHQEDDFMESLRLHPLVAGVVMVIFVLAILGLLSIAGNLGGGMLKPTLMDALYAVALASAALVHLHIGHRYLHQDNRHIVLVLGTLILHLSAMLAVVRLARDNTLPGGVLVMMLPHAIAPLVMSVMMGRRLGLFAAIHASTLGAVICLPAGRPTYLAASMVVGVLAVLCTRRVRRRNRLFIAGCYVGLGAAVFSLLLAVAEGRFSTTPWGTMVGLPLGTGILTGMIVGGLLPMLESVFGVTTEITWLELADLNHPLMRRLSMEAPGTYHHSLMVANLSEAAAEAIGASATMCRVCSYFHDVGKLTKPEYFIENADPNDNPHADLTARMSALVLMAHVKDGVDLAIKHKLNARIIDVIEQHHGTSLTWFFYRQALDKKAEIQRLIEQSKATEDDLPQVSEDSFRYPGPKPQFREAAIISLADAVESSSRTLDKPSATRVEAMVDDIVWSRLSDDQLDECDLTIADLARVKASFVKSLLSMMHNRIKYQQRAVEKEEPVAEGKVISIEQARQQGHAAGASAGDPPSSSGESRTGGRRRRRPGEPAA